MRDLLNQDRAMSPALVRAGTTLFTVLLLALGVFIVLGSLGNLFSGRVISALVQLTGGAAALVFSFLVVRLLGEMLMALHRLNDRLTVLGDDLRDQREPATAKPTPARKSPPKKAAASKPEAKPSESE